MVRIHLPPAESRVRTCRTGHGNAGGATASVHREPFATGILCAAAWQFNYLFGDRISTEVEPLPSPPLRDGEWAFKAKLRLQSGARILGA
jgi:hypothetical protein